MTQQFVPVLLGSDINAYGMARAFHEEYGVTSLAYASFQLAPTRYSKIVDVHIVPDFTDRDVFLPKMLEVGREIEAQGKVALLIACGDAYATLVARCRDELRPYFRFHSLPSELADRLSYKTTFYETCEQYGLPHPATFVLTAAGAREHAYRDLPFGFPVAMKPANSVEWLHIDFEGRKKAFIIDTPQELEDVVTKSYAAGYTSEMIIQDFIPGDDGHMRVLNAYVDRNHKVRMMFLGHPLLEDPTPEAIGNYAVIAPDYNERVFGQIKPFLEDIGYEGVANFDMKYDERDGEYKLFEINLRQGRSSYFVTLNGYNLAKYFAEDLVFGSEFSGETVYGRGDRLWMEVPLSIARDYIKEGPDKDAARQMIDSGKWGTTLSYRRDRNPLRWALLKHMYNIYVRRYAECFREK